jgi:hypothetical protein
MSPVLHYHAVALPQRGRGDAVRALAGAVTADDTVAGMMAGDRRLFRSNSQSTGSARMAPCRWRVHFRLAKGPLSVSLQPMGKVDWFAVVIVMLGMLPVVLIAVALFWR